jgi:hypothetical protein
MAPAPLQPQPDSIRRNPFLCAGMTAVLATAFWLGMIWLAQRVLS